MDLDELRTVQRTEREKDSLQDLRDSFYEDVAEYVQDLKARRDRAAEEADDPFGSDEVRRLTDEIETAEEVSEAIYERRVGKVVKLSSFAAADMSVEREGLTDQERRLFDDLVERIKQNKASVLDILSGESPATDSDSPASAESRGGADSSVTTESTTGDPPSEASQSADSSGMLADAMGGTDAERPDETPSDSRESNATEPPTSATESDHTPVEPESPPPGAPDAAASGVSPDGDAPGETPDALDQQDDPADSDSESVQFDPDRTTVRITRDVGEVLGADDREYELASEDVVTLPSVNAEPLLQKDAAEELE